MLKKKIISKLTKTTVAFGVSLTSSIAMDTFAEINSDILKKINKDREGDLEVLKRDFLKKAKPELEVTGMEISFNEDGRNRLSFHGNYKKTVSNTPLHYSPWIHLDRTDTQIKMASDREGYSFNFLNEINPFLEGVCPQLNRSIEEKYIYYKHSTTLTFEGASEGISPCMKELARFFNIPEVMLSSFAQGSIKKTPQEISENLEVSVPGDLTLLDMKRTTYPNPSSSPEFPLDKERIVEMMYGDKNGKIGSLEVDASFADIYTSVKFPKAKDPNHLLDSIFQELSVSCPDVHKKVEYHKHEGGFFENEISFFTSSKSCQDEISRMLGSPDLYVPFNQLPTHLIEEKELPRRYGE